MLPTVLLDCVLGGFVVQPSVLYGFVWFLDGVSTKKHLQVMRLEVLGRDLEKGKPLLPKEEREDKSPRRLRTQGLGGFFFVDVFWEVVVIVLNFNNSFSLPSLLRKIEPDA